MNVCRFISGATLVLIIFATNAYSDCYFCFNLVPVEISLKNGETKRGLAFEEQGDGTPKKLSTMDVFLLISEYFLEENLPLYDEFIYGKGYQESVYYDASKSVMINKFDIESIKYIGDEIHLYGNLEGLSTAFLHTILEKNPTYSVVSGMNNIICYESTFSEEFCQSEIDKCYELCENGGSCKESSSCLEKQQCITDNCLSYTEDVE